jgi:hypothetical protein
LAHAFLPVQLFGQSERHQLPLFFVDGALARAA